MKNARLPAKVIGLLQICKNNQITQEYGDTLCKRNESEEVVVRKKNIIIKDGNVFEVNQIEVDGTKRWKGFFRKSDVRIDEDGRFADGSTFSGYTIDASGCYVIPGLVDIHTHGCAGYDFCDADRESLKEIACFQFEQGVTSFCPTSMTYPEEKLAESFASANCLCDNLSSCSLPVTDSKKARSLSVHSVGEKGYARIIGINMEGPFISMEKRGAQNPAYIMAADKGMFERLQKLSPVPIRLLTIAPEIPGAMDFIDRFHNDVHISLGHSAADYNMAKAAFDHGACHVTHLYNAMNPFLHREPGIIGAAAEREDVYVELICDGQHVHPSAVRSTFSLFGADQIVLISDSMRAAGLPDGVSELGGQKVYKKGLKATLKDGTLAGSVSSLMDCLRTAVFFGIPLADAVLAATFNPARSIGLEDEIGIIKPGARGNVVILEEKMDIVRVI